MVEAGISQRSDARAGVLILGSGRAVEARVGAKAANLDRAVAAGIAVPSGFVAAHRQPTVLTRRALALLGEDPIAVRSAFSAEDTAGTALAGYFDTLLGVEPEPKAILAAIEQVRASAARAVAAGVIESDQMRLDVLVMRQVDAVHAGVVFTQGQFEDDLVNVTEGLADRLVSGEVEGVSQSLPKLRRFERAPSTLTPWERRLAGLLRSIRAEFGEGDWDIEWADDGEICWLIQIRPITAPPTRNETFTIANHKEILPELPSVLMTSVIESASYDLMEHYRAADPRLPVDRPFIESFAGRPYINLSQLTDLLRRLGLPTRLLSESLGGDPEIVVGLRPKRMLLATPAFVRLGIAQLGAVGHARNAEARIDALADRSNPDFASTCAALRDAYIALVTEMSALATAMSGPVSLLRRFGVLDAHVARQRTPGTAMLEDLAPMVAMARQDPAVRLDLESGTVPTDAAFRSHWDRWLTEHGHRGVFESDIARPRFVEKPAPILRAILHGNLGTTGFGGATDRSGLATTVLLAVLWPLRVAARRPMQARERIRWHAMAAFARLRTRLLQLAEAAVQQGLLPEVEAVFDLSIDELVALDRGEPFGPDRLAERRSRIDELAGIRLPDLVHRFDDLATLTGSELDAGDGVHHGVPLTRGSVQGVALRCDEPPERLPDGFDPAHTILLARSVDAGWVPIFGQVAGVAVEIGGDLSHGSIILRELGIPATTNMGPMSGVMTGDPVRLDASTGTLSLGSG